MARRHGDRLAVGSAILGFGRVLIAGVDEVRRLRVRLLVIEDEQAMAAALQRGLLAEGYVVEVSRDGEDGLWRALEFEFDAVVLDIMLPKLNGFLVARGIREAGCDVPILMLSAKDGEYDLAEALDLGADDYLSKPFSYPVLLARLRALIRRGSTARSAVLVAGDLRVDVAEHRCWRGDAEISLSPKEFALASYLMLHVGELLDKQDILRHVWDDSDAFDSNVVEVYVGYLRRKLDKPFGRACIETVRGRGYRLNPDG